MKRIALLLCFVLGQNSPSAAEDAPEDAISAEKPPAEAVLVRFAYEDKPSVPTYEIQLTIQNRHDQAYWFVVPYYADGVLNESGDFPRRNLDRFPFDVYELQGDDGKIISVGMYGGDRNGFYAFRIPAKGKIVWQKWKMSAARNSARVAELDVWEAADLMVNGTTRLEKWLPYDLLSSKTATVKKAGGPYSSWSVYRGDLNWNREKDWQRANLPTDTVKFVKAEGVSRWKVRFAERPKVDP